MHSTASIRDFLRILALSFPEAVEEFPWGDVAFKVRKKAFLFVGWKPPVLTFSVKLPHSGQLALQFPFVEPTGYGLGNHAWVTARLESDWDVSLDLIAAWIDESYRAVAPKKLAAALDLAEHQTDGLPPNGTA